jgi:hypothetical protein
MQSTLITFHCAPDFVLVDVHDLGRRHVHRLDVFLAARAHAFREPLALAQRQRTHHELHDRVAHDAA